MKKLLTIILLLAIPLFSLNAQLRPSAGIRQNTPSVHALVHAMVVLGPGRVVHNGTVIVRDGHIEAAGDHVAVPPDARVWEMAGATLYPGFIDGYSDLGLPKRPSPQGGDGPQGQRQPDQARGVHHWNQNVLASNDADRLFVPDQKAAEKLRASGITAAVIVPQIGILRGTSSVVLTGDAAANESSVRSRVAQNVAFGPLGDDSYPNSLMGAIALIRQTLYDAQWYKTSTPLRAKYPSEPGPGNEPDLGALADAVGGHQPVVFESSGEVDFLRAARIVKEFGLSAIIRGSGFEYRRLDAIAATKLPLLLPVNFPDPPAVQTPEDALNASYEDLRAWDEAPGNPAKLNSAGVTFAFTTSLLKDPASFLPNVRKAVDRGLSPDAALAALTTVPARLFGCEHLLGTIEKGALANIVVTDGDLFSPKTKILEVWVGGSRYEVKPKPDVDVRGTWLAHFSAAPVDTASIVLTGDAESPQGTIHAAGKDVKISPLTVADRRIAMSFTGDSAGFKGIVRMSADIIDSSLVGWGETGSGSAFRWTAARKSAYAAPPDTGKKPVEKPLAYSPIYPPVAFGRTHIPSQPAALLVRNTTLWTCSDQGALTGADLLVEKGKIVRVGKNLAAPADAVVIDGTGKQCTPGIIDCHSHTAVSGGVNETGKTITADARIGDVIDPDDISVYRELAGGLTVANVLHGSANPIGGQNQVIKLRWGALPEEMKFEGAPQGIKFALGENPKQSNWNSPQPRYPQTREGVEQIIRDEFRAARDYEQAWKDYKDGATKILPRRNLQTEAVLEIIHGDRLVHAHSYRQDEIEMLMRVAEDFGFRIATFQHALESYKVADQLARHGAGASMFSDWWAYKMEVYDAIPYNGVLTHDAGVVVSYNSDSDELARHLTTEAGKAVKYGGLSESEAIKFVTINPARQLRIDKRVGSLEPGKDADFAIWNGNPLAPTTLCEQTWIDGRRYFDRDEDRVMNDTVAAQRTALVQKILAAKNPPGETSGGKPEKPSYSCHEAVSGKEVR
jgi:imidazolonepropionase-like amidohydrolase